MVLLTYRNGFIIKKWRANKMDYSVLKSNSELRKHAKETASKYLRMAFDMDSTTNDERLTICEAAAYYDLPCTDDMISELEFLLLQSN